MQERAVWRAYKYFRPRYLFHTRMIHGPLEQLMVPEDYLHLELKIGIQCAN